MIITYSFILRSQLKTVNAINTRTIIIFETFNYYANELINIETGKLRKGK